MPRTAKLIHTITIKRMIDEDPDTSWLGDYSNTRASDYSIDRKHTTDCASVSQEAHEISDKLQRAIDYLYDQNLDDRDAIEVLEEAREESTECDCNESGDARRGEYRYFNPSSNYDNETPENVRKYTAEDYARMEALNAGQWSFVGIRAEAEIRVDGIIQHISSGGLWGIESDSDDSYLDEVANEELHQLKEQLRALGFSARAIAKAFADKKEAA